MRPAAQYTSTGRSVLMLFWTRLGRIRNEIIFNDLHS